MRGEFRSSLVPAGLEDNYYLIDREENRSEVGRENRFWRASRAVQY